MIEERMIEAVRTIETDRILKWKVKKFSAYLIEEKGLFESDLDFKLFVLDQIIKAITNDECDFPISFNGKKEKLEKLRKEIEEEKENAPVQLKIEGIPVEREEH